MPVGLEHRALDRQPLDRRHAFLLDERRLAPDADDQDDQQPASSTSGTKREDPDARGDGRVRR